MLHGEDQGRQDQNENRLIQSFHDGVIRLSKGGANDFIEARIVVRRVVFTDR